MLILRNISKHFSDLSRPVLDNINLEIKPQDYCVIIGSNGSGKSTLLKIISGEYQQSSGDLLLDGSNIKSQSISKRAEYISSVAQDVTKGTVADLTVMENIALSNIKTRNAKLTFYELRKGDIKKQITSLGLGLEDLIDQKMSNLSGGQRQSVATLMATSPVPKILLLDEHTSALDPKTRSKIMQFTDHVINSNNITTLMITHNIQDALKCGNRLLIMSKGKIIRDFAQAEKAKLSEEQVLDILHEVGEVL